MRPALGSPKEYRDFAAKCLRWAARAKREDHKNMMLKMANHWMQTAHEMESAGTMARDGREHDHDRRLPPLRGTRSPCRKHDRPGSTRGA
jgi:hypothetical protein